MDIYSRIFKIRGRCTKKTNLVSFNTQKGEGKVFNAIILDETGSIQLGFYNELADKFYPELEEG